MFYTTCWKLVQQGVLLSSDVWTSALSISYTRLSTWLGVSQFAGVQIYGFHRSFLIVFFLILKMSWLPAIQRHLPLIKVGRHRRTFSHNFQDSTRQHLHAVFPSPFLQDFTQFSTKMPSKGKKGSSKGKKDKPEQSKKKDPSPRSCSCATGRGPLQAKMATI